MSEQRLDLGRVGPALAEPGGESVTGAVRAQAGDAGVVAGGEHDLGDAGDGERAALPGPDRSGVAAAHVQPRGDKVAGAAGQRGGADFVALAVQADLAGAGGDREVLDIQPGALLDPRAGVQQHRDDRGITRAAARGRTAERGLLRSGERVRLAGSGDPDALLQVHPGYTAERQDKTAGLAEVFEGMGEGLAEWIITTPDGAQLMLQLAYFDRGRQPVLMEFGPVLDLDDAIGGKVAALATRAAERDYIDVAAALARGYTVAQLTTLALALDPGLAAEDFADAGQRLDRLRDDRFAPYGLTPDDVTRLRKRFAAWPRTPATVPGLPPAD